MKTETALIGALAISAVAGNSRAQVNATGEDGSTLGSWRTAAVLETDNEYGTDGYVLYGFDRPNGGSPGGGYVGSFDASSVVSASPESQVVLPGYITDISLAGGTGMWPGSALPGNFGDLENPADSNNPESTSVLANGADPYSFTITRNTSDAFRLVILLSDGDGNNLSWNTTVNAGAVGSAAITGAVNGPNNTLYHVFDIAAGTDPIVVTTDSSGGAGRVTGFAFDAYVAPVVFPQNVWQLDGSGDWSAQANWAPDVPNGAQNRAQFDDALPLTAPLTAALDVPVTLGELAFDSAQAITIVGPSALTFEGLTGAVLSASAGNHELASDMALSGVIGVALDPGTSIELSGAISGGSSATISGGGNLVLSGDVTALGTASVRVDDGAFIIDQDVDVPFPPAVSGTGSLIKRGTGLLTFSAGGQKTHTGGTVVEAGTLDLAVNDAFGNHSASQADLTIEDGALVTNGAGTQGYTAMLDLTLNGGEFRITNSRTGSPYLAGAIKGGLRVGGTMPSTISNNPASPGTLMGLGRGAPSQIPFTVPDVTSDAGVDLFSSAGFHDGAEGGAGSGIDFLGGGTVQLTGDSSYTGPTTIDFGMTVLVGDGGPTGSLGTGAVTNDGTLIINRSADLTMGQVISGSGTFEKSGSGTLTVSAISAFSPTVSGGILALSTAGVIAGNVTVADGAGIGGDGTISGNLVLGATTGGAVAIDPASATGVRVINLTLNGVTDLVPADAPLFGVNTYSVVTYSGSLTDGNQGNLQDSFGSSSLRVGTVTDNAGTIEVGITVEASSWTGTTSGDWQIGGPDNNWSTSDGFFFNFDEVLFDDSGSNKVVTLLQDVAPGELDVNNSPGNDYTFQGGFGLTGPTALYKDGMGGLTILNDNAHTGGTTIFDGAVTVGNGGTTGSLGSGPVVNDGVLTFNRSDDVAFAGPVTGFGEVVKTGPNTMTLTGVQSMRYAGATTVAEGTVDLAANDVFGNHPGSQAELIIEAGALVTNGAGMNGYTALLDLVLNGGELRITNSRTGAYPGYAFIQGVTVGGSAASSITHNPTSPDTGISLGREPATQVLFDVADVTTGVDLDISAGFQDGQGGAGSGITKTGAGTMALTRTCSYTGPTVVEAGTLALTEPFLDDFADVALTTGAVLQLDFVGTDVIDELSIDGVGQAAGTWGSMASSAANKTDLIAGTGLLDVFTPGGSGFDGWASGFGGLTDTNPELDFEGDTLDTGLEYVLAGDPTVMDVATIAPSSSVDPSYLDFVYRRSDLANGDPDTTIEVEYGSDMVGWTVATHDPGGTGVIITEEDDPVDLGPGIDRVTVRIPRGLAPPPGDKLFARLKVTIGTP